MRTEIAKEKYNPFMKRKELVVGIENPEEPTPQKAALQQLLAKEMGKEVEHIEVYDIMPENGMPKAVARVFIWDEKKVKDLSKKEEKAEVPVEEQTKDSKGKEGK